VTVVSDEVIVDDAGLAVDDAGVMVDDGAVDDGDTVDDVGVTDVDVGATKVENAAANATPSVRVRGKNIQRRYRVFSSFLWKTGGGIHLAFTYI